MGYLIIVMGAGFNFSLSYGPGYLVSSANLRFQKRVVSDFGLFKRSQATGLTAPITIVRNFLVHFALLERDPLSGLSAPITIIKLITSRSLIFKCCGHRP